MGSYTSYIQIMYKCWYRTQEEKYPLHDEYLSSWLLNIPELFSSRAPGMTCMGAIEHGATGLPQNPIKNSKGCGGVMRVAPIGLYFCDKPDSYEKTDMLGAEAAQLTHGHDLGYIPAAALVHIIRAVVEKRVAIKDAVVESFTAMEELFPDAEHISDFSEIMKKSNCSVRNRNRRPCGNPPIR